MSKKVALKYQKEMSEFLGIMGWNDVEIESNIEGQQVIIATGVDLDGQDGRAIIEANSDNDLFDFYIYYTGIKCKINKYDQMKILMNEVNRRWQFGRFECIDTSDNFYIRWRLRIDFEGSTLTALTIKNNFKPGWDAALLFASTIAAVALTNQSAADAISEYDQEQEERNKAASQNQLNESDGPSEL